MNVERIRKLVKSNEVLSECLSSIKRTEPRVKQNPIDAIMIRPVQ